MAGKLIIFVGNIGTGKSRYRSIFFTSDEIILCPDEWTGSKAEKQKRLIFGIENGLRESKTVVVDGNNLTKNGRAFFVGIAKTEHCECIAYDFGAGNDKSLKRRLTEPDDFSEAEWMRIHNRNQMEYEQ